MSMIAQQPASEDRIRHAVAMLTAVFESLGAEHQALMAEAGKTSARERRGTVVRMGEDIAQAARTVSLTIGVLATVHGMRDLGVNQQFSKDAEGRDYTPLLSLANPSETLYDALVYLGEAATTLGRTYTPTKKHPGLAVARCPKQMKVALCSLRAAFEAVAADIGDDDPEVAEDYAATQTFLIALEKRVCRTMPAQSTGPTPEEVLAAIRADPKVASAAAAALAALAARA
uniref:hypothetical protein n=1 Tax=Streptomyces sp. CA-136453 TaxID=3240050 RepID=UPI003F49486E